MTDPMIPQIGRLIRQRRISINMRARQVANYAGMTAKELAQIEWQQSTDIDCLKLRRLAQCLGLQISELFDMVDSDHTVVGKEAL